MQWRDDGGKRGKIKREIERERERKRERENRKEVKDLRGCGEALLT